MLEIMKSIFRMDQDQGVRRIALQEFNIQDGYYEYETHIFFDDAFQLRYMAYCTKYLFIERCCYIALCNACNSIILQQSGRLQLTASTEFICKGLYQRGRHSCPTHS